MEIDHLIYGVPELGAGIAALEGMLGVRAAMGGKHTGLGTHNALLSLGEGAYLEIIARDPEQPAPSQPLPWGLAGLRQPRLLTWAVKATDIDAQAAHAKASGVDLGPVLRMSRERPDGVRLEWALTYSLQAPGSGLVPFLIAWEPGPHPSETSPGGCRVVALRAEHPEPSRIDGMLSKLGVDLPVWPGAAPRLIASIECPKGGWRCTDGQRGAPLIPSIPQDERESGQG